MLFALTNVIINGGYGQQLIGAGRNTPIPLLTSNYVVDEIRLFDLCTNFKEIYQNFRTRLRTERLDLIKHQGLARLGAGLFAIVVSGLAVIWIGWWTLQGLFNLVDLALFYQSFNITAQGSEKSGQVA